MRNAVDIDMVMDSCYQLEQLESSGILLDLNTRFKE